MRVTFEQITLGSKGCDTITGFAGVVVAKSEWLNGCKRITIQPCELKDGKPIDPHTFDVQQIDITEGAPGHVTPPSGGPMPEPTQGMGTL